MVQEMLHEKLHDSILYRSDDDTYRILGGFVCMGPNLIRFEEMREMTEEYDSEGAPVWTFCGGNSIPFDLLAAKMVLVELEEIVRHASHPRNENWRLVQLRWEPTITVERVGVGLESGRVLLKQLQGAILEAELIEGYQDRARDAAENDIPM